MREGPITDVLESRRLSSGRGDVYRPRRLRLVTGGIRVVGRCRAGLLRAHDGHGVKWGLAV